MVNLITEGLIYLDVLVSMTAMTSGIRKLYSFGFQTVARTLRLTPSQTIEPLIPFLESPTRELQHVGTEVLSHLLAQEHFQQDITTKDAVVPLVRLTGIRILTLQETAVSALEKITSTWPKEVADAGGIFELSKIIIQDDPEPSLELWEAAALILSNLLRFNTEYYYKFSLQVLVRMLQSTVESTIQVSLDALLVHERADKSNAEQMTEAGVVDALLDLLRSHHCEEMSGRLLEALFNKVKVREMKISKSQRGKELASLGRGLRVQ